jgi:hypothetical protein
LCLIFFSKPNIKIDDGLICEIDETARSFSLQKLILLPLLIIATIICGYFALPTTRTVAVTKSVEQVNEGYVTKNIEDIEVGDEVFAYDISTGNVSKCKVTDTFERTSDHLRYLTVRDSKGTQVFETTDSHPFWVVTNNPDLNRLAHESVTERSITLQHENIDVTKNGYYVEAKDLKIGDNFIGPNHEVSTLEDTSRKDFANGIKVYNFTVENNHNYFVIANYSDFINGKEPILVHNANKPVYRVDKPNQKAQNKSKDFETEIQARSYAMRKLGKNPVKPFEYKYRSYDGVWQYRAKPSDVNGEHGGTHVHLEKLDIKTGDVLINIHLYFKKARGQ